MSYYDLSVVVPIRIDSQDRLRNLKSVVSDLKRLQGVEIIILEADKEPTLQGEMVGVRYEFVCDSEILFHRTRYINQLCSLSNRPYIGIWDSDVIIPSNQIASALGLLRNNRADMVLPFDGRCYNIGQWRLEEFIKHGDISILEGGVQHLSPIYGYMTCGGAFIVNRAKYVEAGGENEAFKSWGPEDLERYKRWEVKGYNVSRIDGPLFHLAHKIGDNSRYFSPEIKKEALKTLLSSCRGEF